MEGFDPETFPSEVAAQLELIEKVLSGPWSVCFFFKKKKKKN